MPIYQLLGGAVRDRVLVHYWSGRLPPEALARVAREGQQMGFGGIKIKCVLEDPNVERVQAVYEACGPDFRISLDPNQRFRSIRDTLALAEALADYPVEVFEDPLPKMICAPTPSCAGICLFHWRCTWSAPTTS